MKKLPLILIVFLFCSGFGVERWYEQYGISKKDIYDKKSLAKLVIDLNSNEPRHVERSASVIAKISMNGEYFDELVSAFKGEICLKYQNVAINVMRSAFIAYDSKIGEIEIDSLVDTASKMNSVDIRVALCQEVQKRRIYTKRILSIMEFLYLNDKTNVVRHNAYLVISNSKNIITTSDKNKLPPVTKSSNANVDENPHAIAVVIGNIDYMSAKMSVPNVDYAINDAKAIKDVLVNVNGYRDGNILYFENATQAAMVSTFGNKDNHQGKLYNWVRPESDVFIYYSGHGAPSLKDGSGYLLPVDADPSTVELNGYPINTLYQNIGKLQAKSITLVIDACFSGSSQGGTITKNASSITLKPITMPKIQNGINVLSATNVGEIASWDTEAQHSLFTSYFLKALSGAADKKPYGNEDHKVDLAEVQKYVNLEVTYMARRNYGRDQNPQINGNSSFVFSTLKE